MRRLQSTGALDAPAISVTDLHLAFAGGSPLFAGLSFDAEGGVTTCILGPSGCGKSTLLRFLCGARGLTARGRVAVGKRDSAAGRCAWMGQEDLLLPWLNLFDNVLLGARLRGEVDDGRRHQAAELIARAGLAGYERTLPAALSGGMRQRAALLRTLMEGRPVLLMDEPFSALDALTRVRLQDLAAEMTAGATTLLVTHDPLEALRLARRIIILGGSPTAVKCSFDLAGSPPRGADDGDVTARYGSLLRLLLEESS